MIRVGKYEIPTHPGRRATLEVDDIPGFSVTWTGDCVRVTLGAVSALSASFNPRQTPQDKFASALDTAIKRVDGARKAAFAVLRLVQTKDVTHVPAPTEADTTIARLTKQLPKKPPKKPVLPKKPVMPVTKPKPKAKAKR